LQITDVRRGGIATNARGLTLLSEQVRTVLGHLILLIAVLLSAVWWHGKCNPTDRTKGHRVKFTIVIGETEKHRIEYNFNQFIGSLVVKVNEQPVKKSLRLVNEPLLEIHVIAVGKNEKHEIRIEKERKQLLGHRNRVFVDNRLFKVVDNN
jgi:hypothetical protein